MATRVLLALLGRGRQVQRLHQQELMRKMAAGGHILTALVKASCC